MRSGHDRDALGALLVLPPGRGPSAVGDDELRLRLFRALERYNREHATSSERLQRALVLGRPLSLDDGETTDKGYTNQRRVLERRADEVRRLFATPPDPDIFVLDNN